MEKFFTNTQVYGLVIPSEKATSLSINNQTLAKTVVDLASEQGALDGNSKLLVGWDSFLEVTTPLFTDLNSLVLCEEGDRQGLLSLVRTIEMATGVKAALFVNNTDYQPSQRYRGLKTHGYRFFIERNKEFDLNLLLPGLATLSPITGGGVVMPKIVRDIYQTTRWFALSPRALSVHKATYLQAGPRDEVVSTQTIDNKTFVKYATLDNLPSPRNRTLTLGIVLLMHRLAQAGIKLDIPSGSYDDLALNFNQIALNTPNWQYRVGNYFTRPGLDVQWAYLQAAQTNFAGGGDFTTNWIISNWRDRIEKLSHDELRAYEIPWVWKKAKLEELKSSRYGIDSNLVKLDLSYHSINTSTSSFVQVQERDERRSEQPKPISMRINGTNVPRAVTIRTLQGAN